MNNSGENQVNKVKSDASGSGSKSSNKVFNLNTRFPYYQKDQEDEYIGKQMV